MFPKLKSDHFKFNVILSDLSQVKQISLTIPSDLDPIKLYIII